MTHNGNTKHKNQRPAVTPVVSLNGYKRTHNPKAASPHPPRMPQTRLTNAHRVVGLALTIVTRHSSEKIQAGERPSALAGGTHEETPVAGKTMDARGESPVE